MLLPYVLASHGWVGPLWGYSMGGLGCWHGRPVLHLVAPGATWLSLN